MNRVETAVSLFDGGFLCSQALLSTYGKHFGVEEELAERIATGFGAGMGRLANTCGAVTGAIMLLGLKYGGRGDDLEAREATYQRVREFVTRFKARNSSVMCRELLDCDISSPQGLELAKEKELFATVCPKLVRDAAEILDELL